MSIILLAIGSVCIVEGLAWALAPSSIEKMLEALREMPDQARRLMGLIAIVVGLIFVWCAAALGI